MRCPKCHYISFDSGDRCRNCGYEFSLALDTGALDLPIQTGDEPIGPLSDLSLSDLDTANDRPNAVPAPAPEAPPPSSDLPLFNDRGSFDDRPLVTPPAVPRPPLAVRRASPVVHRPPQRRPAPVEEPELDLAADEDDAPDAPDTRHEGEAPVAVEYETASAARRLAGGVIDLAIIGAIDALVLYFTLRLSGLEPAEIAVLPIVPLVVFLVLLNGGYFTAFTVAGGQTIGKMAASTRVVPADDDWSDRVPLPQAALRTAAYLVSLLPLGAGFFPALVGERRALHDRLAATRVVNA